MNFFDGDFGLGSMSSYNQKPRNASPQKTKNFDQLSFKSGKKDEFDDLLDDMLNKQQKKNNKNKEKDVLQQYSSSFLDPSPNPYDFKKTQKWSTPNIEMHNVYNESPKFPNSRNNTHIDDRGSEDGRSYKSGFTRQNQPQQFDNLITLRGPEPFKDEPPAMERSTRNMMRPPLAKKDSRENLSRQKETSILNDDTSIKFSRAPQGSGNQSGSMLDIGFGNLDKLKSKESKTVIPVAEQKIKERIIQKQKIITVREEATELKKQFQNEVKQIKESYERQLKSATQKLKEQIEEGKKQRLKLIKEHQTKLQDEKNNYKRLLQQNNSRLKQLHQWQMKKKCQSYQLQIQKLKSMSKLQETLSRQQNVFQINHQNLEIKARQRQLQTESKKIQQLKYHLEQRERSLQFQQKNFDNYRRREEQKLQNERRALLQKENDLKKNQLQTKRMMTLEKQKVASELANSQIQLFKKREALNLEKQQMRINKQLFEKQKMEFENFNKNTINDYRNKVKELQAQREHLHELEIDLHKKIYTVQMTADARGIKQSIGRPSSSNNQQNRKNRANSQMQGKFNETKERFYEMQQVAKKSAVQTQEQRDRMRQKVNVSGYINRLNRALTKH